MSYLDGKTLRGYKFEQKIGTGGFGEVYRAVQTSVEREVAIKVILPQHATHPEFKQRFEAEARLVARLEHPYIIPLHDYWQESDGSAYLVMRYLRGGSLSNYLEENGVVPPKFATKIVDQIASALAVAHRAGVVHRDLKPANILLDNDGNAYLTDFGIAKDLQSNVITTGAGKIVGSPAYLAPEQINATLVGPQTDVYALGIILFEMITGKHPFETEAVGELLVKHLQEPIPLVAELHPEIPQTVDLVIQRATAKNSQERYSDIIDLAVDFRNSFESVSDFSTTIKEAKTHIIQLPSASPGVAERKQITLMALCLFSVADEWEELEETEIARAWQYIRQNLDPTETLLEKSADDRALVAWGSSAAREDFPEQAIRMAMGIFKNLPQLCPNLSLRVAIHTGLVVIKEAHQIPTGDTLNLTQRILQIDDRAGVYISQDVFAHVRGVFDVRPLDVIAVGNRHLQIYAVEHIRPRAFRVTTRGVEGIKTQMIGRDAELRILQEEMLRVLEDADVALISVVGEAGIGKSRLLQELETWYDALPSDELAVRVFNGRATPDSLKTPFSIIRDAFDFRFEIRDNDSPQVAKEKLAEGMNKLVDGFAEEKIHLIGYLLGFDFSESPYLRGILDDKKQIRDRAFFYFAQFLKACWHSDTRPRVIGLFLEDLHWADDSSLELITYLTQECNDIPLYILCPTRPSLFERYPFWGEGLTFHTRIDLRPLPKRDTRRLVKEILQKAENIPTELRDLIVENSEGNPFYVEELIKMFIDDGVIVPQATVWEIKTTELAQVQVPATLAGVIQARLDRLSSKEKLLLQRAAVVGRIFWDEAVASLMVDILDKARLNQMLEKLRERELIYRHADSAFLSTVEYTFKHAILREVIYETVLLKERRNFHTQIAQWLMQISGARRDEYAPLIADHFLNAKAISESVEWYTIAAKLAENANQNDLAEKYYRQALTLLPLTDEVKPQRLELLERLGALANEFLAQALGLAEELHDKLAQVRILRNIVNPNNPEKLAQLERSEVLARELESAGEEELGWTLATKAALYIRLGESDKALKNCQDALTVAEKLNNENLMARANYVFGIVYGYLGHLENSTAHFEKALSQYQNLHNQLRQLNCLVNLSELFHQRGDYANAQRLMQEARPKAQEMGVKRTEGILMSNLIAVHIKQKNFTTAETLLTEIFQEKYQSLVNSIPILLAELRASLTRVRLSQQNYDEALELAQQILQTGNEINDTLVKSMAWRVLGIVAKNFPHPIPLDDTQYGVADCFQKSIEFAKTMDSYTDQAWTLREWALYEFGQGNAPHGTELWGESRNLFDKAGADFIVTEMQTLPS